VTLGAAKAAPYLLHGEKTMDLRQYFKKIRDTEESIAEQFPLVVSVATSDGGQAGNITEVSRHEAAKAIAEGRATLASDEQKQAYLEREAARKQSADKAELSRRLQIAIVSESDLRSVVMKHGKDEKPKGSR
jgi:hypothetical protein